MKWGSKFRSGASAAVVEQKDGGRVVSGAKRERRLVLVLGDQLDAAAAALDDFDAQHDAVWMAEVVAESEYVWSSKPRIAVFLSAMRHFRDAQRKLK